MIIRLITCAIIVCHLHASIGFASSDLDQDTIRFTWKSNDKSLLESKKLSLSLQGAEVTEISEENPGIKSAGVVIWFLLVGATATSILADSLVDALGFMKDGGLAVDTKGGECQINEAPNLKTGQIIIRKVMELQCGTNIKIMSLQN